MGDDAEDDETRQRVRDAILKAGGVPAVAARTGIPVKTLENYLSKRSTPSLDRAAKIAAAAGISVADLAGEAPNPTASAQATAATAEIIKIVGDVVATIHKEEGVRLPDSALIGEVSKAYLALFSRMDVSTDVDEARALIPWLDARIRKALREAAAAPGTGKREAS